MEFDLIKAMGYKVRESTNLYRDCDGTSIFHLYVKNPTSNKETHVHCGGQPMYFLGENIAKNAKEAEEIVEQGKGVKIIGCDLYRQYYKMDDKTYCIFCNGYDQETKNYLDRIKGDIGLLRYTSEANSSMSPAGEYTPAPSSCKSISVFFNSSEVVYWQMESGEWIAQYGFQIEIDDYAVTKFYFDAEPTDYKIRVAYAISQIEIEFSLNNKRKAEQTLEDLKDFVNKH